MLDNYLEPLLARQTIRNTEFAQKFEEWFGTTPKGLVEPSSDEIWGITFTQSRPVQFIFDGNRFGIAIAGSKFTRDEEFRDREWGERKTRVTCVIRSVSSTAKSRRSVWDAVTRLSNAPW